MEGKNLFMVGKIKLKKMGGEGQRGIGHWMLGRNAKKIYQSNTLFVFGSSFSPKSPKSEASITTKKHVSVIVKFVAIAMKAIIVFIIKDQGTMLLQSARI